MIASQFLSWYKKVTKKNQAKKKLQRALPVFNAGSVTPEPAKPSPDSYRDPPYSRPALFTDCLFLKVWMIASQLFRVVYFLMAWMNAMQFLAGLYPLLFPRRRQNPASDERRLLAYIVCLEWVNSNVSLFFPAVLLRPSEQLWRYSDEIPLKPGATSCWNYLPWNLQKVVL